MGDTIATGLAVVAAAYAALGLAFGLFFVFRGVSALDKATAGASTWFRLIILPASAALWPLLALRWRRAAREARP